MPNPKEHDDDDDPMKRWTTNLIIRIKEQETLHTLQENDDDDNDDVGPRKRWRDELHLEGQGTRNTPNLSGTC